MVTEKVVEVVKIGLRNWLNQLGAGVESSASFCLQRNLIIGSFYIPPYAKANCVCMKFRYISWFNLDEEY